MLIKIKRKHWGPHANFGTIVCYNGQKHRNILSFLPNFNFSSSKLRTDVQITFLKILCNYKHIKQTYFTLKLDALDFSFFNEDII